jgi:protease-4
MATYQLPSSDQLQRWFTHLTQYAVRAWRWLAYAIGSIVLIIIILLIVLGQTIGQESSQAFQEKAISGSGPDKIAVISVIGTIGNTSAALPITNPTGVSLDQVRQQLRQAQDDTGVKAVILTIDSPGGSAVISDQIWQQIQTFKTVSHKPVVAQLGDTAASGGYYIATAADKIVANPASLTGSIGVIMEYYDASGLLNKLGITPGVVKSGPYKDIGSPTRPTTTDEQAILQSVIDDAYQQFDTRVATGRQMTEDNVKSLADGRIFTGSQAKDNGLVDELGNQDKAISLAKQLAHIDSASVVEYSQANFLQGLLSGNSQLASLLAIWQLGQTSSSTASSSLQYIWRP